LNLEFSLELTGFDMAEIDLLIEGACRVPEEDADDLHPPVGSGPAIARPGDLWLLGVIACIAAARSKPRPTVS
jgi:hypothetical protein